MLICNDSTGLRLLISEEGSFDLVGGLAHMG